MEIADQESDLYKELIRNCAFYLALYLRCGLMGTDKKNAVFLLDAGRAGWGITRK